MAGQKLHRRMATDAERAETETQPEMPPTFVYDDCCPLCKGYTSIFTKLGWADRQGFSTIDGNTMDSLDFATARHHIPLYNPNTDNVAYGLDGILGLVREKLRFLRPIIDRKVTRNVLDRMYWFITYNRRHIVSAPPPNEGVDCAPDFKRNAVVAYHAFCLAVATAHTVISGAYLAIAMAVAASVLLVANRDPNRAINNYQAGGHVGSVVIVAAGVGAATSLITSNPALVFVAVVAVAARKIWLRRWMVKPKTASSTVVVVP